MYDTITQKNIIFINSVSYGNQNLIRENLLVHILPKTMYDCYLMTFL
jgi:hypothetical protein